MIKPAIKPKIEKLGQFKLKDRVHRRTVKIEFDKLSRPPSEIKNIFIQKTQGVTNGIFIGVEWKDEIREQVDKMQAKPQSPEQKGSEQV